MFVCLYVLIYLRRAELTIWRADKVRYKGVRLRYPSSFRGKKLGSFTCPVYSTDTRDVIFSWKGPVFDLLLNGRRF